MTSVSLTDNASQGTQIEQARAVAEVIGSIRAAREWPRDEELALQRFLAACSRMTFAERAFFRFRRGTEQITGPTIHFMEEAARCWGNMSSGSAELVRRANESEMLAYATDLETNYTRRALFVNPHTGYTDTPKMGADGVMVVGRKLISVRDKRENNQSAGSRVEREMIDAVLPAWYVELGVAQCYRTLAGNAETPIEDRRRALATWFEEKLSIRRDLLVAKIGVPFDQWLPADLAVLRVIGQSIHRGESTFEAEFSDVAGAGPGNGARRPGAVSTADLDGAVPAEAQDAAAETVSRSALNGLFARLGELGLAGRSAADRRRRLLLLELITNEDLESANDLSAAGAAHAREVLGQYTADDLAPLLATVDQMIADGERTADTEAPDAEQE